MEKRNSHDRRKAREKWEAEQTEKRSGRCEEKKKNEEREKK